MNKLHLHDFAQYQRAQGLSPKTVKNREHILLPLARFIEVPLIEASTQDLRGYLARKNVKPSTLRVERAAMKAFYQWAVEDGLIEHSPADGLPTIRVPRRQPRPFTHEQVERMLNSGAYRRTRVMIMLGFYQGFRVSQIARVHGHDIDADAHIIRTLAKGNKERYLPLHPEIRSVSFEMPQEGYWFPSPRGGHIKGESVTDAITAAIRRAGITDPSLTPHSLRHSFGSNLVELGVDIRVVQELMLHEDLSTTQVYTRVSDAKKRAGIELLSGVSLPARSSRGADLRLAS